MKTPSHLLKFCVRILAITVGMLSAGCSAEPDSNLLVVPSNPPTSTKSVDEPKAPAQPALPRYTTQPLRELRRLGDVAEDPAVSPDGKWIATGCQLAGDIAIWNWPEGSLHKVVSIEGASGVVCLCFSEDSQKLAYSTLGRSYGVVRVSDGEALVGHNDSHYRYSNGLVWAADSNSVYGIAHYAHETEVHCLSLATGKSKIVAPMLLDVDLAPCSFRAAPFLLAYWVHPASEECGLLALSDNIDLTRPKTTFTVPARPMIPYSLAISHDGTHFAFSEGSSLEITVYNMANSERIGSIEVKEDQLGSFQFVPGSNSKLVVYSGNNTWRYSSIAIRDVTVPKLVHRLEVHAPTTVTGTSLSRDGKLLALGFYDGEVGVWDVAAIEKAATK